MKYMFTYFINNLPNDLIYKIVDKYRSKKMIALVPMKDNYVYPCIENGLSSCEYIKNISMLPPQHACEIITYLAKTEKKYLLIQASMNINMARKRSFLFFLIDYHIPIEPLLTKYFF